MDCNSDTGFPRCKAELRRAILKVSLYVSLGILNIEWLTMQGSSPVVAKVLHFEASAGPNGPTMAMMSSWQLDIWKDWKWPGFLIRVLIFFQKKKLASPALLLGCLHQLVTCFSWLFWVHVNNLQLRNKPYKPTWAWLPYFRYHMFFGGHWRVCIFCQTTSAAQREEIAQLLVIQIRNPIFTSDQKFGWATPMAPLIPSGRPTKNDGKSRVLMGKLIQKRHVQ